MSMMGQDQDDVVVIPYTSAMKRLFGMTTLRTINVQAASAKLLTSVQEQITGLLRQRHRITPGRDDDFTVRNQQEIADMATEQSKTMRYLLAAVAFCVGTTILVKMHGAKYMWVTCVPLVWLVLVTFTAGLQKLFSDSPTLFPRLASPGPAASAQRLPLFAPSPRR